MYMSAMENISSMPKKIVPVGDGHLQEQYEKLKKKLEAAGYFDEDRKLPIPKYVKKSVS